MRERYASQPTTSVPSTAMLPTSGRVNPRIDLMSVVLPAPFGPTIAITLAALTTRSTDRSTSSEPNRLHRLAICIFGLFI